MHVSNAGPAVRHVHDNRPHTPLTARHMSYIRLKLVLPLDIVHDAGLLLRALFTRRTCTTTDHTCHTTHARGCHRSWLPPFPHTQWLPHSGCHSLGGTSRCFCVPVITSTHTTTLAAPRSARTRQAHAGAGIPWPGGGCPQARLARFVGSVCSNFPSSAPSPAVVFPWRLSSCFAHLLGTRQPPTGVPLLRGSVWAQISGSGGGVGGSGMDVLPA